MKSDPEKWKINTWNPVFFQTNIFVCIIYMMDSTFQSTFEYTVDYLINALLLINAP